jgi:hypothetical protein
MALFRKVLNDNKKRGLLPARLNTSEAVRIIVGEAHMVALMVFSGVKISKIQIFVAHLVRGALQYTD